MAGDGKERLSDVIQRERQAEAPQSPRKKRSFKSLVRKLALQLQNKVCSECECSSQEHEQKHQPKFIFRVIEPKFRRRRSSDSGCQKTLRLATMNVALFSLAPVVPTDGIESFSSYNPTFTSTPPPLAAFLLEPLSPTAKASEAVQESEDKVPTRYSHCSKLNPAFSPNPFYSFHSSPCMELGSQLVKKSFRTASVLEVLRDTKADLIALQEVKADEQMNMSPLKDLAEALGMQFAYAESWAPEFGNAILSRWPIKSTSIKKIYNTSDYRNLLKVVVDVPAFGELHFSCTHLDHLDEDWRLKQVSSILEETKKQPHILAGDLNSLSRSDYSQERWKEIAKLRAENRKMAPRTDVMERLLVDNGYVDACAVASADGQDAQATCKHNTRIDYILASSKLPYKFVQSSYKVVPSRGTSDHHLVMVDIVKR